MQIDLNADLGEGGAHDQSLLTIISSASISCGAHAGDDHTITAAIRGALKHNVLIGAHPSFPDRENFGREDMNLSRDELATHVSTQLDSLKRYVLAQGGKVHYVKPHGALYNRAARDPVLARELVAIIRSYDNDLALVALAGSALFRAGRRAGLETRAEAFADRAYAANGTLLPRSDPLALITEPAQAVTQVLGLIQDRSVASAGGGRLKIEADTICLHGDSPQALVLARSLRDALQEKGIQVRALAPR